jgi:uncharacterized protein YjiS (DUF1127 family)
MISHFTTTPASAPISGDLRQWVSRWFDRRRDAGRRRRKAETLAGMPDEVLRDIGVARCDFAPPRCLMLPVDRR